MVIFASRYSVILCLDVGVRQAGSWEVKLLGWNKFVSRTLLSSPLLSIPSPSCPQSFQYEIGFILLDIIQQGRIESHEIKSGWIERRGKLVDRHQCTFIQLLVSVCVMV